MRQPTWFLPNQISQWGIMIQECIFIFLLINCFFQKQAFKWNSACLLISSWSSQSLPSESKRCLFLLGCPERVLQQPLSVKSYNNPWFWIFDYNSVPFGAWAITNIFSPSTWRRSNPSFFCPVYQVRMIDPQVIWKEKNWVLNLLKFPN